MKSGCKSHYFLFLVCDVLSLHFTLPALFPLGLFCEPKTLCLNSLTRMTKSTYLRTYTNNLSMLFILLFLFLFDGDKKPNQIEVSLVLLVSSILLFLLSKQNENFSKNETGAEEFNMNSRENKKVKRSTSEKRKEKITKWNEMKWTGPKSVFYAHTNVCERVNVFSRRSQTNSKHTSKILRERKNQRKEKKSKAKK